MPLRNCDINKMKKKFPIICSIPNAEKALCNYYDYFNDPHTYLYRLSYAELAFRNRLYVRATTPRFNGVGFLYLSEIYEFLELIYMNDRNIGITTNNKEWHMIDVNKEILTNG